MAIEIGSKVWLKHGSPSMTVTRQMGGTKGGIWLCSWFSGQALQEASFDEKALTETNPNPPSDLPIKG